MRFLFDNNISFRFARMLAALGEDVVALRDEHPTDISDVDLLKTLRGRDVVFVSAERKMRGRPVEVAALKASGATCLFFAPFYSKLAFWQQAEWLIRRWKLIDGFARGVQKGTCAIVQHNGKSVTIRL